MIIKNSIATRIAGKVSRFIDASMNRIIPSINYTTARKWDIDAVMNTTADADAIFTHQHEVITFYYTFYTGHNQSVLIYKWFVSNMACSCQCRLHLNVSCV